MWISKAKNGKAGFSDNPSNIKIVDANHLKKLEKELREAKEEIEILTLMGMFGFCF